MLLYEFLTFVSRFAVQTYVYLPTNTAARSCHVTSAVMLHSGHSCYRCGAFAVILLGSPHQPLVVLPIHCHRHVCRCCNRLCLGLVVFVLRKRSFGLLFATGKVATTCSVVVVFCLVFVLAPIWIDFVLLQTNFMQCTPETYESTYLGANRAFLSEGCETFQAEAPMTMALSVLVIIELLNALNRFLPLLFNFFIFKVFVHIC
jgi:hypothetical protein